MLDDEGTTAGNGKAIVVQFDKDADQWMGVGDIVGNDRNEGLGTSVAMSEEAPLWLWGALLQIMDEGKFPCI